MAQETGGALTTLRARHIQAVLKSIATEGPATQAELSRRLGLSRATISNLIADLKESGEVTTAPVISSGRRALQVQLLGSGGYYLGVDMDSHKVAFVICDATGEILTKVYVPVGADGDDEKLVEEFNLCLASELKRLEIKREEVRQACVGVSSPVNPVSGELLSNEFFRNWDAKRIIEQGLRVVECPVFLDNDATLAAVGEKYYGSAGSTKCFVMVYVERGIGAGLIINGEPYSGFLGMAGEIGHNRFEGATKMCRCGNIGCVETVASVRAVVESCQQINPAIENIDQVLAEVEAGNVAMERLISDAGSALGKTLVPLINTLNPQRVYIGGSRLAVDPRFVKAFQEEASRSVFAIGSPRTEFAVTSDWQFMTAMGAAARARLHGLREKGMRSKSEH